MAACTESIGLFNILARPIQIESDLPKKQKMNTLTPNTNARILLHNSEYQVLSINLGKTVEVYCVRDGVLDAWIDCPYIIIGDGVNGVSILPIGNIAGITKKILPAKQVFVNGQLSDLEFWSNGVKIF